MKTIEPIRNLDATVRVPGSKSMTQRALVIAGLAEGRSRLQNALAAEDTRYLTEALRSLGAGISAENGDILVTGTGGRLQNPGKEIYLGNNGTAMRFLTGVVCLGKGEFTLTGSPRLCNRPVGALLEALRSCGVEAVSKNGNGCPPVTVRRARATNGFPGGHILFTDIESSQFVSALMICAPYGGQETTLELRGLIRSYPYLEMTCEVMEAFGVPVDREGPNRFIIPGGRPFRSREYRIEGDVSSASYFFAAAALCGGRVRVENINPLTRQGDIEILHVMEQLGCKVARGRGWIEVRANGMKGGDLTLDLGNMPDMVPTLAVLAAGRCGRTVIQNVGHLRLKESDRLSALASELRKTGIQAEETGDGISVEGGAPRGAEIETYHDHRMAMSFAVLGLAVPGMGIKNPGCVEKSFPDFWERLEELHR